MKREELRLVVAGTMLIGVSYGLARFAYGLFLPNMREDVGLSSALAGFIGSGAYVGYCFAIVLSALLVERLGARCMAVIAALIAAAGMAMVSVSTHALWLAAAILLAGTSTGLASPPMAQAVSRAVPETNQGRANTLINAGTSLGVAVSGPVAFIATGQWRIAYAAFAVFALLNALLLWVSVPRSSAGDSDAAAAPSAAESQARPQGLLRPRALKVVLAAAGMGTASAAYWTFSSDVVITLGQFEQATANVVWILIGVAGLVGGLAGDLVKRFGLNVVNRLGLAALALSLGLLVLAPANLAAVLVSAALFGGAYIMLTGVYLVWGIRLYADRPAIGLGLPFLMIAVGQVIGSPLAGYLIGSQGYAFCFTAFSLMAVATAFVSYRPDRDGEAGSARKATPTAKPRSEAMIKPMTESTTESNEPLHRFYMPAMPPLALIDSIARTLGGWLGRR